MSKIYRLVRGEGFDFAAQVVPGLPAGKQDTGFWSPHPECIKNLIDEYEYRLNIYSNSTIGEDYFYVLEAELGDCEYITDKDELAMYKVNDNPDYDKDEVFVCKVTNIKKYKWKDWYIKHFGKW